MPPPGSDTPNKTDAIRRILILVVVGAALAMAAVHFTNAIQHDIQLHIEVAPDLRPVIEGLELHVLLAESEEPALSMAFYHFDPDRPMAAGFSHRLKLPNGRYLIAIRISRQDGQLPVAVNRQVVVDGDGVWSIHLP